MGAHTQSTKKGQDEHEEFSPWKASVGTRAHMHARTQALLRGTATPKCWGSSATILCFSSCSWAPRDPGTKGRLPQSLQNSFLTTPEESQPTWKLRISPTNQNHQAGPLPRLLLVPGHLLIGQQLLRLSSCSHLCLL